MSAMLKPLMRKNKPVQLSKLLGSLRTVIGSVLAGADPIDHILMELGLVFSRGWLQNMNGLPNREQHLCYFVARSKLSRTRLPFLLYQGQAN